MNRLFKSTIIAVTVVMCISMALAGKPPKPEPSPSYCCAPPYIMDMTKPNILIMVQMNESMYRRASASINNGQYDSTITYYGYFNPEATYMPVLAGGWEQSAGLHIPGNMLNWAIMSRIDVARRALFAGMGQPSSFIVKKKLLSMGGPDSLMNSAWPCTVTYYRTMPPCSIEFSRPDLGNIRIKLISGNIVGMEGADITVPSIVRYTGDEPYNTDHRGIVHMFGDDNDDNKWDDDAPRVGLMFYSDDYSAEIKKEVTESEQAPSIEDFVNQINNNQPSGAWANPGEALLEAIHYIKYTQPHFDPQNYQVMGIGSKDDPWYTYNNPEPVSCRRTFLVLIGDGEAHEDNPSVGGCGHLPQGPLGNPFWDYDGDLHPNDNVNATDPAGLQNPADDYALYGHVTDLRDDIDDKNNVTVYTIQCFGSPFVSPDELFKEIAKNGGFKDQNGDNLPGPDSTEWDEDGDGIPDNYYLANSGDELEQAMSAILLEIMTKVNSASGVAVVTTGMKGGGSTVQSQFYPSKKFPTGELIDWVGNTHSLWLDPFGWIREDTEADAMLHLQNDHVINMAWDPSSENVLVTRLHDVAGTGDPSQFDTVGIAPVEQLRPIWQAGEWLWNAAPGDRDIKTFIDADDDGLIEAGELIPFNSAQAAMLQPYLDVTSVGLADTLIQYIRGTDFPNLRTRTADGKVWKLGDIMNSGAVAVQPAIERYDFIYGDNTYANYYDLHKNRRQAIYVGANDGMLHCFNGGVRVDIPNEITPFELDPAGFALGEELWAYIPQNMLAHLKWLKDSSYCHVYYVDMKPYATDAKIFADDATHPNGWGTILIGGMRLGGLDITIKDKTDTLTSSYFAIDVTDPLNPVPMWEFTDPDLNLTVCYPTVIKVKDSWYLIFGSGPESCAGECAVGVQATVYVLDLATGTLLKKWVFPDDQSFITNIFGVDWGMDYNVDRIYFGDCYYDNTLHGDWGGKIYRINTNDETNPALWDTSFVFNMERPITAEGSISTDDYNHLWVYFGTGRFFSEVDEVDTTTQRYIGIRDDTTHATTVAGLYNVTDVKVDTNDVIHFPGGATGTFAELIDTVNAHGGWWREHLGVRERNLTTALVFGGAVLYTTYLPESDICSYGGTGRLYALYYRTGTAHINPSFLKAKDTLYNPYCVDVGQGMPSEPSLYVSGDQIKVFIQAAGGIVSPETGLPGLPKTGVILWKGR